MEQLETELSARSTEFRQAKQAIPLEELQGALSKDCVLVDFVEYSYKRPADKKAGSKPTSERRLVAFVVTPDRPVEMVSLRTMQPIDEAIETWRVTFGMSADGAGAARRLRERLWAPLEEKLHETKIVLISPDGALSRLPFGALPGKTPGSYLIEDFTFAVVPVPQLIPQLVREEGRKQLRKKLLLLGNVDYDAPPARSRIGFQPVSKDAPNDDDATPRDDGLRPSSRSLRPGTLHFAPLPGTEGEIAAIEDVYRHEVGSEGVTALRKSQAGKEAFLAEARQYGYLHLATHGFFIEERVPRAAVGSHESGPLQAMVRGPEAGASYPALLSGLALAGANRSAEQQPSPPAPLPSTGEGSELPSPPAPLPAGEGSKLSSPPAPLPQSLEGRQEDDGILAAEEIGVQNLDGVEIVVLSACESGLGKQASGEGVLGLQRSFQSAGARSVVASLWSVDDAATKSLMVAFYTNLWEKKLPKLEALRQAQLTMLRGYDPKAGKLRGPGVERPVAPDKLPGAKEVPPGQKSLSPFYWASFVLSGDWK
jgi:CHAT domain-containing protein